MNDITTVDGYELEQFSDILGSAGGGDSGDGLIRVPKFDHQHSPDDDDGNVMPRGEFRLHMPEGIVYAKKPLFRPLMAHIQYYLWEDDKLTKSLVCNSLRDEARDTAGGIACGMPEWEVRAEDKELRQKYKDCQRRVVRGLVTMDGHTLDGSPVKIENQPAIYFGKGSTNYGGFFNEYMKVLPKGARLHDYQSEMSTERMKVGETVFFKIHWKPLLNNKLALDRDAFETMKVFAQTIRDENKYIDKEHFAKMKQGSIDTKAIAALGESLDDDFEDVA